MPPFFMIPANKTPKNIEKEMIDLYLSNSSMNCAEVGRKFNKSNTTILRILKRNNVKIRNDVSLIQQRFKLNQDYFNKIDSEEKAYFLGLMYADGNIIKIYKKNVMSIQLQEEDCLILEKFKLSIETDKTLKFIKRKNEKHKNCYKLAINNKKICDDLIKLGCVPAKSLILDFPTEEQVPNYLLKHFIRGYFDGDGGISTYIHSNKKGKIISVSFVSSITFIKKAKNYLEKETNCYFCLDVKANPRTGCIYVGGNIQAKRFLDWLYKDSTIYLQRKYDRYKKFYEGKEEKYGPTV